MATTPGISTSKEVLYPSILKPKYLPDLGFSYL